MNKWPTRYSPDTNGIMCSSKDGHWVQYDSFDRLLTVCAKAIKCREGSNDANFASVGVFELKTLILEQIKEDISQLNKGKFNA